MGELKFCQQEEIQSHVHLKRIQIKIRKPTTTQKHTHKYTQIHTNTHKYTQIHTNTHKYTQIDTHTHTYTNTRTHVLEGSFKSVVPAISR